LLQKNIYFGPIYRTISRQLSINYYKLNRLTVSGGSQGEPDNIGNGSEGGLVIAPILLMAIGIGLIFSLKRGAHFLASLALKRMARCRIYVFRFDIYAFRFDDRRLISIVLCPWLRGVQADMMNILIRSSSVVVACTGNVFGGPRAGGFYTSGRFA